MRLSRYSLIATIIYPLFELLVYDHLLLAHHGLAHACWRLRIWLGSKHYLLFYEILYKWRKFNGKNSNFGENRLRLQLNSIKIELLIKLMHHNPFNFRFAYFSPKNEIYKIDFSNLKIKNMDKWKDKIYHFQYNLVFGTYIRLRWRSNSIVILLLLWLIHYCVKVSLIQKLLYN